MSSELIKHTSDASFDGDVLKSEKPVLVDYSDVVQGRTTCRYQGRGSDQIAIDRFSRRSSIINESNVVKSGSL